MHGVILYGPPGAGKDTITSELHRIDERYVLFPRLKLGPGRTAGYRLTSSRKLATLRAWGEIIYENQRYGSTYAIGQPGILQHLAEHVPVLHAGQHSVIAAVTSATPDVDWTVVHLWCPRDVATARITARGTGDLDDRLRAWDETEPVANTRLAINTAEVPAEQAAQDPRARERPSSDVPPQPVRTSPTVSSDVPPQPVRTFPTVSRVRERAGHPVARQHQDAAACAGFGCENGIGPAARKGGRDARRVARRRGRARSALPLPRTAAGRDDALPRAPPGPGLAAVTHAGHAASW